MAVWNSKANAQPGINSNAYDYAVAYAKSRSDDPIIQTELVATYITIAQSLGVSINQFISMVQAQGNTYEQDLYLTNYLNTVRVRNALLGVGRNVGTPGYIAREINP